MNYDNLATVPIDDAACPFDRDAVHKVNVSLIMKLITRIVGKEFSQVGDKEFSQVDYDVGGRTTHYLFDAAKTMLCAVQLMYPVHKRMVETNLVEKHHFGRLLDAMDGVYPKKFMSPRENLHALRDTALFTYMKMNDVPPNSSEMENLLNIVDSLEDEWVIYCIMADMGLLTNVDHKEHHTGGLYDGERQRVIAASWAQDIKTFFHCNEPPVYKLVNLLRSPHKEFNELEEIDIVALRTAMACTVPMRRGVKVERGTETEIMLRVDVPANHYYCDENVICVHCGENKCDIYAPKCRHFVSCESCMDDFMNNFDDFLCKKCQVCETLLAENKVFFMVGRILMSKKSYSDAGDALIRIAQRRRNDAVRRSTTLNDA